ncbi:MAG: nucleotidyltransferase family protein [Roseiflexus sp.]|nr:nucleotidyltransferase family protein [Roseiflexus sp.]MDW8147168.1 hypothetical protein [Roseiflexaceae bacterium]MDW8231568.1 hypothetical protein [Roseiflexaceae bacterium]
MSLIAGNLSVVQRTLDAHHLAWAVCAGAAAHLYGNRRPIQDIDILVEPGKLLEIVRLLNQQQKVVQFDGQRILWRGIKIFDDLTIRRGQAIYPFTLDAEMRSRVRRLPLLGSLVPVLSPEDVALHKALLARGPEEGKHDIADATAIARRQALDYAYLQRRLALMRVDGAATAVLARIGITL